MKTVIIQGSSRKDGHTEQIIQLLLQEIESDVIHLPDYRIGHFDYDYKNQEDDFPQLIQQIADRYELIIFATPVYWYTMSGHLKVFFDRLTDCLKIDENTGKKLEGKTMAAIGVGSDPEGIEGFFVPFRLTAPYMTMKYAGDVFTWIEDDRPPTEEAINRVLTFAETINDLQ